MDTAEAAEMRGYLTEGVQARRLKLGRLRAVASVAQEVNLPELRVVKLLRGDIHRVWADEYNRVKRWYGEFLAREAERAEHQAMLLRARREAMDAASPPP